MRRVQGTNILRSCLSPSRSRSARMLVIVSFLLLPVPQYATQAGAGSQADPATAEITRGLQYLQRKDLADAKLRFSAAIKANPQSADALTWRGITENQLQQYEDAARD